MYLEDVTWQDFLKGILQQKTDYSIAFALATTRTDGRPNIRHVGLKDVMSLPRPAPATAVSSTLAHPLTTQLDISTLLFSTDIRSPKCAEIVNAPECALSAWLPETGVQLRIDGYAYLYRPAWTKDTAQEQSWILPPSSKASSESHCKNMQDIVTSSDLEALSRALFEGLSPRTRAWHSRGVPGGRLNDFTSADREAWLQELEVTEGIALQEAARNFALLVVVPYEVDLVQIVSQGLDRRWQWKLLDDMSWVATELVP
ncbi:hypothetical protein NliqN6_4855 [Naganishia liquefaciens]|uniref:Pyridoxamine 5'-phosphate oxidase Alr4036 family FMN-binding domain-containing protein n=1 Tax=Naganishia liquefaciens TaxID=104408 RepID=A0A8H3TWM8_9TREE|nr:hypothetical protein NliqN6_4855 [Naganishia liquefaciens]